MIPYPDYSKATNAAYVVLLERQSFSLSTNVFAIVDDVLDNCRLITYGQACTVHGYVKEMLCEVSEYGFSIVCGKRRIILYNEDMPLASVRFTIAHEIGHAVLLHSDEHDDNAEKEANCFARNLLCPIPVVVRFNLETISEYTGTFDISMQMASVAIDKRQCDHYNITGALFTAIASRLDMYLLGFDSIGPKHQHLAS